MRLVRVDADSCCGSIGPFIGRLLLIGLGLCSSVPSDLHAQEGRAVDVAKIADTWAARQKKFQTVRFAWTTKCFVRKNSSMSMLDKSGFPPEDVHYEGEVRMWLKESLLRAEIKDQGWSEKDQKYLPKSVRITYDGSAVAHYKESAAAGQIPQTGAVSDDFPSPHLRAPLFYPIIYTYRAFDPVLMGAVSGDLTSTGRVGRIENAECVLLKRKDSVLWISTEPSYPVRRYSIETNGREHYRVDMRYRNDPQAGPVPSTWVVMEFEIIAGPDQGLVNRSWECNVTESAFHEAIPDDLFSLEFPSGTHFFDQRKKKSNVLYVRKDGTNRLVPPQDYGATNEQLETTAPGLAHTVGRRPGRTTVLAMVAIGVVVVAGYVLFRRVRIRNARSS